MDFPLFLYETPDHLPESRPVVLWPVPMEETVSYGTGTVRGPARLLLASQQVEYYLPFFQDEPCRRFGIETRPALAAADSAAWVATVEKAGKAVLSKGGLPLFAGGEHTLTIGGVQAALAVDPETVVVQIDAHADLREALGGNPLSHGSVMRRCREAGAWIVSAGVRAFSAEEAGLMESDPAILPLPRHEWSDPLAERLRGRPLYLTIDLDGLDPAVVPGVGNPVPGGLLWEETLDVIRTAVEASDRVLGIDVVELAPQDGDLLSPFAAAKLLYIAACHGAKKNGYF